MSYTPPNPWLWYTFKNNYGTTVFNKGTAGPSMDGTLMNSAVCSNMDYAINGMSLSLVNNAVLSSQSTGQYISVPSFTFGGTGFAWSFSCWFKKQSGTVTEIWARIFDFCVGRMGNTDFCVGFVYNAGTVFFGRCDANLGNTNLTTSTNLCNGNWHHVVVVYDGSTTFTIYINNSSVASTNQVSIVSATRSINFIGRSTYDSDKYSSIIIDDFRLYSGYCLTTTDIAYLYNLRPVLMYDFEYVTGVVVPNMGSLGTSYNGNLSNTMTSINTTTSAIGINSLSISTTKTSGYMSIPSSTFSDPTYHWTICFYYNITYISGGNTENYNLICLGNDVSTNICINCINNGNLLLLINNTYFPICASSCYDSVWRHVALVYNATTTTLNVYFNGVLCTYPITTTAITNITRPMYIGDNTFLISDSNTYNTTTLFIDDFRLYNNILLSVNEISQICGNNVLRTTNSGLLNTILNAYIPNTTMASTSSYYTKLGKNTVNLNTVYYKSYSLLGKNTSFNNGLFTPASIPGCCLFLSAEKENVILNNGKVQQWNDLSGNNNNAVQNTVNKQPSYNTSDGYMNNNPSIYFGSGVTVGLDLNNCTNLSSLTSFTLCIVLYMNKNIYQQSLLRNTLGGASGYYKLLFQANSSYLQTTVYNNNACVPNTQMYANYPYLFITTVNINQTTYIDNVLTYFNGTQDSSNNNVVNNGNIINLTNFNIGYDANTGSSSLYGGIHSVTIYNSILTILQRQQLEGYMMWKLWSNGTKFNANHPYYIKTVNDISNLYNINTFILNTVNCSVVNSNFTGSGYTNGNVYFGSTSWVNYFVYITGSTSGYAPPNPVSCQVLYTNNSINTINASLILASDDNLNALYINNINIVNFNQYYWPNIAVLNISLLPGINVIDVHNVNNSGLGGIAFYIKKTDGTLLCQTDANTKCRYI